MARQARSLNGKIVAITGGARGIGKATAKALVAQGREGRDRRPRPRAGRADRRRARRRARSPSRSTSPAATPSRASSTRSRSASARSTCSSTTPGSCRSARSSTRTTLTAQRMVDINVHGVMYGMKLALPRMQRRGRGHIVNIASQAGQGRLPGRRHLLRHQARRRRPLRGGARRAARHRHRGLLRDARGRQHRARLRPAGDAGVKVLEPEDVAEAIVDALEHPKFDVWVPRESVGIYKFMQLLPRSAPGGVGRLLKADKVLADADPNARAAYEDRAAHSEPGLGVRSDEPRERDRGVLALTRSRSARPRARSRARSPARSRSTCRCPRRPSASSPSQAWSGSRRRRTPACRPAHRRRRRRGARSRARRRARRRARWRSRRGRSARANARRFRTRPSTRTTRECLR